MGSSGPELGRNPSKGENFRGLQGKPRIESARAGTGVRGPTSPPPRHRGREVECPARQPLPQGVPEGWMGKQRLELRCSHGVGWQSES